MKVQKLLPEIKANLDKIEELGFSYISNLITSKENVARTRVQIRKNVLLIVALTCYGSKGRVSLPKFDMIRIVDTLFRYVICIVDTYLFQKSRQTTSSAGNWSAQAAFL